MFYKGIGYIEWELDTKVAKAMVFMNNLSNLCLEKGFATAIETTFEFEDSVFAS